MTHVLQLGLLILGFVFLVKGADWFVDGVSEIAARFGIPQLVIGLTIVAMGTSLPEAAVSLTSAIDGYTGITFGNVVGSNIINILLILGITSLIANVPVKESTFKVEIPFVLIITFILLAMGYTGGQVTRLEAIVLLVIFAAFMFYLFKRGGEAEEEDEEAKWKDKPMIFLFAASIIGILAIKFGADFVVDAASYFAELMGVSDRIIGLTVVAFGTSLPELVTSATAAVKGKTDIAIGNIVGSDIFNILFIVGLTGIVTPVTFANKFIIDTLVAAASVVTLWLCLGRDRKLDRSSGVIMLAAYAAYFVYLLIG